MKKLLFITIISIFFACSKEDTQKTFYNLQGNWRLIDTFSIKNETFIVNLVIDENNYTLKNTSFNIKDIANLKISNSKIKEITKTQIITYANDSVGKLYYMNYRLAMPEDSFLIINNFDKYPYVRISKNVN